MVRQACLFGVLPISAASLFGRLTSSAIQLGAIMLARDKARPQPFLCPAGVIPSSQPCTKPVLPRAVTVKAGALAPPGGLGLGGREHGGMLDAAGTAEVAIVGLPVLILTLVMIWRQAQYAHHTAMSQVYQNTADGFASL